MITVGAGLFVAAIYTIDYIEYRNVKHIVDGLPHRFDLKRCTLGMFCEGASAVLDLDGYPNLTACEDAANNAIKEAEETLPSSFISSYKAECEYYGPPSVNGVVLPVTRYTY
ncbi:hypothetical protein D3C76_1598220 [compost metagenome]